MRAARITLVFLCCLWPQLSFAIDFGLHGYYRDRFIIDQDLDTQRATITLGNDRFGMIQYSQMRLRLDPMMKLNDNLSIHSQFDILDNIVFGSKETEELQILSPIVGTQTLPAGPGSIGVNGGAA